jgi:hypothetical protein|tara:strand:+ start:61 stop:204 length:144 start_codon:yes stop_codon:yes gene_type:complete
MSGQTVDHLVVVSVPHLSDNFVVGAFVRKSEFIGIRIRIQFMQENVQ